MRSSSWAVTAMITAALSGAGLAFVLLQSRPVRHRAPPQSKPRDLSDSVTVAAPETCPGCRSRPAESEAKNFETISTISSASLAKAPLSGRQANRLEAAELVLDLRYAGDPLRVEMYIALTGGNGGRIVHVWSPEQNSLRLPPGRYQAEVFDTYSSLNLREFELELAPGVRIEKTLDLSGEVGLYGRIKCPEGKVRPLQIVALPARVKASSPARFYARAKAAGRFHSSFSFERLALGRYTLGFSTDKHCAQPLSQIEFGEKALFVELTLPPLCQETVLRFEAFDPQGKPFSDQLSLTLLDRGQSLGFSRNGARELSVRCPGIGPSSALKLKARHRLYGSASAALELDQSSGIWRARLSFREVARIEASVPGFAALGYESELNLTWSLPGKRASHTAELDRSGRGNLLGIDPGRGTLALVSQANGTDTSLWSRELDLRPGQHVVEIDVPKVARLEVTLLGEPLEEVSLTLGEVTHKARVSRRRRAFFRNLPHGRYLLKVGRIERWVTVPGPTVEVRNHPIRSMRVRITDQAGALYRQGLRDGDRIIAVDGNPVNGEYWSQKAGPRPTLIHRGDVELELEIDITRLYKLDLLRGGTILSSRD